MKRALAVLGLALLAFASPAAAAGLWDEYEAKGTQQLSDADAFFNALIRGGDSCELVCRARNEENLKSLPGLRKEFKDNLAQAKTGGSAAKAVAYHRPRLETVLDRVKRLIESEKAQFRDRHWSMGKNITGKISGKVVPSAPPARVTIISGNGNHYSGPADPEGGYVQSDLTPGNYVVVANVDGKKGSRTGILEENGSLVLVITLGKDK